MCVYIYIYISISISISISIYISIYLSLYIYIYIYIHISASAEVPNPSKQDSLGFASCNAKLAALAVPRDLRFLFNTMSGGFWRLNPE